MSDGAGPLVAPPPRGPRCADRRRPSGRGGFGLAAAPPGAGGADAALSPFPEPLESESFRFNRRWLQSQAERVGDLRSPQFNTGRELNLPPQYLLIHRGGRGQSFVYELVYRGEGEGGRAFFMGLADVAQLAAGHGYDRNREHQKPEREESGSTLGAGGEHAGSKAKNLRIASADAINPSLAAGSRRKRSHRGNGKDASYTHGARP